MQVIRKTVYIEEKELRPAIGPGCNRPPRIRLAQAEDDGIPKIRIECPGLPPGR
jgi:hypothetical protein